MSAPPWARTTSLAALVASLLSLGLALAAWRAGGPGGVLLASLTAVELVGLVALALAMLARRPSGRPTGTPEVSVLVAAWNERPVIARTVARLLEQDGVALEVIVADDGSTDGTDVEVERVHGHDARVRVLRLPHGGKGAALEAARRVARHALLATVDADTELEPGALARLCASIREDVVAAGGAVLVKDAAGALGRFQFLEYVRTTWVRAAWAELGMLEQLPGAFSVFSAAALERAGGFPLHSLTEDYEVGYRLYDDAARSGRRMRIAFVPEARAWTAPPDDLTGFVRQRTRWFAGFLSTWARFVHLVGSPSAGRFGLVRLPIKAIDALAPLVVVGGLGAALLGEPEVLLLSLGALGVRALTDLILYLAADALTGERHRPRFWLGRTGELLLAAVDGMTYGVFRALVVLRAYPFALARVRTWERSRAPALDEAPLPAE